MPALNASYIEAFFLFGAPPPAFDAAGAAAGVGLEVEDVVPVAFTVDDDELVEVDKELVSALEDVVAEPFAGVVGAAALPFDVSGPPFFPLPFLPVV